MPSLKTHDTLCLAALIKKSYATLFGLAEAGIQRITKNTMHIFLFTFSFLFLACHSKKPVEVRLMTYNIRYSTPNDGPNWWEKRKEKVADLILKNAPDILGVQEALEGQIKQLDSFLVKYNYYGVGRDDGKIKGEYSAIFYDKEKLKLINSGTFWLSETPEIIGSVGWDAAMERICSWVLLENINSNKSLLVFNAHFDHIGKEARKNSILLIAEKVKEIAIDAPAVFMGDLNFTPDELPYPIALKNGFKDSFVEKEKACTYTGFVVDSAECKRIDYIFTNDKIEVGSYLIDDLNDGKYYPSDHLPVVVDVSF